MFARILANDYVEIVLKVISQRFLSTATYMWLFEALL